MRQTRRAFAGFLAMPAVAHAADLARLKTLRRRRRCGAPTVSQTEGPYFTPDTPLKRDFRPDARDGAAITVAGYVLGQDCKPVANALIELAASTRP